MSQEITTKQVKSSYSVWLKCNLGEYFQKGLLLWTGCNELKHQFKMRS